MIIVDFNGIAISAIVTQKIDVKEDMIRHMILNTIRMYNKKYRAEFGQLVVACDSSTWRRDYFPEYKYKRRESRDDDQADASKMDWKEVFRILSMVIDEIRDNLPYKVVRVDKAEADDIIGSLVEMTQEFGKHEPIMIVSADKDFVQLQKYSNVQQFSPLLKKEMKEKNPRNFLYEHIFKGDSGDGVPNILSPDNTFVTGTRQKPVTAKKMEEWFSNIDKLEQFMDKETYRNFIRNKKLIDLSETPSELREQIINTYESQTVAHKSRVLNYLIEKRCRMLIESVGDFH
jgi:5'-3' exonuclease